MVVKMEGDAGDPGVDLSGQGSCGKGETENRDKYASSEVAEGELGPLT